MTPEKTLAALGLELPPSPEPGGVYKPVLVHGGLAYVSGHPPRSADGTLTCGRVGADLSLEEGKQAARQVGLGILSIMSSQRASSRIAVKNRGGDR